MFGHQTMFGDSLRRRANARNVSFRISLRWPIHIINPVDKTQLSRYTSQRRSTTVSLETYLSILMFDGVWWPNIYRLTELDSLVGKRPEQTGTVWRPNTIKHCLVTKQANVEVNGQKVKACLIKHRGNN